MILKRTNSDNSDFISLVAQLDQFLAKVDGETHEFYHQFNGIDVLEFVIVAYADGIPVACGALKSFDNERMEVKRMFTKPDFRGQGFAQCVLTGLEEWASEEGDCACVLETGVNQQEAIRLYEKMGYKRTENYGQYVGVEDSFCFEKQL